MYNVTRLIDNCFKDVRFVGGSHTRQPDIVGFEKMRSISDDIIRTRAIEGLKSKIRKMNSWRIALFLVVEDELETVYLFAKDLEGPIELDRYLGEIVKQFLEEKMPKGPDSAEWYYGFVAAPYAGAPLQDEECKWLDYLESKGFTDAELKQQNIDSVRSAAREIIEKFLK